MAPRHAALAPNQGASDHAGHPAETRSKPGTRPRKLQRRNPPSLELSSKPRDGNIFSKANDSWWWEVSAVVIGVANVGVIAAILGHYNGKSQPEWPIKVLITVPW